MSICMECDGARATQRDPRDPPLDVGVCLCPGCYVAAANEVIEELDATIKGLKLNVRVVMRRMATA